MNDLQQREELTRELTRALPAGAKPSGYSLALNFLPLLHFLAGAAFVWFVDGAVARIGAALAWVYILPPLACRVAMALFGAPQGEGLGQEARAYKVWWFLMQMQVLFNRFAVLEELLRMVPGLYALWLNGWGARVSSVVYWGPGALVVDRQAARIGPGAVIGVRAVLSGHLAVKDSSGAFRVTLAAAFLRPFTQWTGGRRVKADRPRLG